MKFFDQEFEDIQSQKNENAIRVSRRIAELNNSNITFGGLNGTRNDVDDEDDNF